MKSNNLALVQQAFAYFGKGDMDHLFSLMAPDICWVEPGTPEEIPYAGVFTGKEGVLQLMTVLAKSIKIIAFIPTDFIADDKHVVVTGTNEATVIATGKIYKTDWVYLFKIHDQKIQHIQVWMDTSAIAKAFRP
jgi:ketosteroid isomerase-like protein